MAIPATFTLTIAPSTTRVLERQWDDPLGSYFKYEDANEVITMQIRHSQDTPDKDGIVMSRHNVFLERVVFATPTTNMLKYSTTNTVRYGTKGNGSAAASATLETGINAWINSGTIAADLANGLR